ncbi:MAG TPA: tetratricopeptide repeat protein [Flavobacteriaceae bacterium]|nr:tetratricopeptide repeat protein [Flavobacteriaceae bacterium]
MRYLILLIAFLLLSFTGNSQDLNLAKDYLKRGEYAKAESLYKKLFENRQNSFNYLEGLVETLQQQEKYEEAGTYLADFKTRRQDYPVIYVEIGRNYELQGEVEQANESYKKAISLIEENTGYTSQVGRKFHGYNLLDQAEETYKTALAIQSSSNYILALARIYGEQQKLDKMFSTYMDLIIENPRYRYAVNRSFSDYITADPGNEANRILRKMLLKKLQEDPDLLYNEFLSWLYIQEGDFKKAFIQQKAIFQRSENKSLSGLMQLAQIAAEKDAFKDAEEILNYAIVQAHTAAQEINGYNALMEVKVNQAQSGEYNKVKKEFDKILQTYGQGPETLNIQLQYARFLAFKQSSSEEAKTLLRALLKTQVNTFEEAKVKMQLADILASEENFNQALILYSQIKSLVKNTPLAQEALFKVAQTSYYKGDFDWAQTQLKVLKQSTSELTANDAMALNLLIQDNISMDSMQTALKLFAKADLFILQEKDEQALSILEKILDQHEGEKIEDEALLRAAKLHEKQGAYEKAEAAYLKIIRDFSDGILADDAYYFLAELYRIKLDKPEEAMENYKKIIFDHADSIFFVDARKKFRQLRGDDIQ